MVTFSHFEALKREKLFRFKVATGRIRHHDEDEEQAR